MFELEVSSTGSTTGYGYQVNPLEGEQEVSITAETGFTSLPWDDHSDPTSGIVLVEESRSGVLEGVLSEAEDLGRSDLSTAYRRELG